jgi:hypothetical protein
MFREGSLIEEYITGIRSVLEGFCDYGFPKPKFEEIGEDSESPLMARRQG